MKQREHTIAVAFAMWWAYNHKRLGVTDGRLLFAVPNGGARHIAVARKMKAEGIRAGVPDYFLAVPKERHGLFLELKAEKGRLSHDQAQMIDLLAAQGYAWAIAYGTDQAIKAIEDYLK